MLKSSIIPFSDKQQYATVWLERFFKVHGDCAPNRNEVHLSIMHRKDLYDQYVEDFTSSNRTQQIVSYSRFNELWNVLFPWAINRPWCSIPGKCNVCGEIDRFRRVSRESYIQ
jgi:hypothetical protein